MIMAHYTKFFWLSVVLVGVLARHRGADSNRELSLDNETSSNLLRAYEKNIQKAFVWLMQQRNGDWGWEPFTPQTLLTIQLWNISNSMMTEHAISSLQFCDVEMSLKQLEIEVLLILGRFHESAISAKKLSWYVIALSSLCKDPKEFFDVDLTNILSNHDIHKDYDFAFAMLAICNSGSLVKKKQIKRLSDIASAVGDHNIDTISMVILALKCIMKENHRNLQHFIRIPSNFLASQQQKDGSFGNLYSTSLAIQALHDDVISNAYWNKSAAVQWMLLQQQQNGSFGDIEQTNSALLALAVQSLYSIRDLNCNGFLENNDTYNSIELETDKQVSSLSNSEFNDQNVTITYSLWIENDVKENHSLTIIVARNTTFFDVMQMAADMDPSFGFKVMNWPNGHYVHTIGTHTEDPNSYYYWLLYRLPEYPDPSNPPVNQLVAPKGVDDLFVDNGQHYLFWYKKL